jgi:hypothetical protein
MKKMKTTLLLSCVMLSACMTTLAIASGFPDVDDSHPNKTAIDYFLNEGIFIGYPDGTFQPDRVLNRAEQLKVFMLLSGADPAATLIVSRMLRKSGSRAMSVRERAGRR